MSFFDLGRSFFFVSTTYRLEPFQREECSYLSPEKSPAHGKQVYNEFSSGIHGQYRQSYVMVNLPCAQHERTVYAMGIVSHSHDTTAFPASSDAFRGENGHLPFLAIFSVIARASYLFDLFFTREV